MIGWLMPAMATCYTVIDAVAEAVVIHLAVRVHVMRDNANDQLGEFRQVNFK